MSAPARLAPWVLAACGGTGLLAAFALAVEKSAVLADPGYVPTCSIDPVLSCGSVMRTWQAEVFGFPNPLLGVAGFAVVATVGAVLLAGAALQRWFLRGLHIGATAGVVFVHWLIYQSLYVIGALCPYCMVVWAVTIPVFWYTTLLVLTGDPARPPGRVAKALAEYHGVVLTAWYLLVAVAVLQAFWTYWTTGL